MRSLLLIAFLAVSLGARTITVGVCNLENLFDADGRSAYEDYGPAQYTAAHLGTKLKNAAAVVAAMAGGRGPDVILFEELETDLTPSSSADVRRLLAPFEGRTLAQMLAAPQSAAAADLPAEAWLLKALEERGLTGYRVIVGDDAPPDASGTTGSAVKTAVFTRLPVKRVTTYPIPRARRILEVELEVDGHALWVFANHWKSGANDAASERVRVEGARILRARLDEILGRDPYADILIGGDFNSQYNQRSLHPRIKATALNDVLGSQGDPIVARRAGPGLYNLWHELPADQRGSDVYRGAWGTLVQLIVSRGLLDEGGLQYVEGSFRVVKVPGLNMAGDGTPLRWSFSGAAGSGCSDHFPIVAQFRTLDEVGRGRWMELKHPSDGRAPTRPVPVGLTRAELERRAIRISDLPPGQPLRDSRSLGRLFLVEGWPLNGRRLGVELAEGRFDVFAPDPGLHAVLRRAWRAGRPVRFYGELAQYRGRWEFVVKQPHWLVAED
ncbi:endonuclease/exonuclease/phosphatase family protein [mine drainage metagenome]|uniref:Endonuclease/exonuclease/phosphatase family protein n=1 Tax=mine drainage metagenome TaxID=410659 RepID=A0A1J5SDB8_9ZZZZ